ncbi:hypothetical protein [Luteimonas kalidii]|uniref:DUF2868 domain-containing protein n=1 Tax=Luteimonas kalidii TaxID=3042025 RepID=A0ABT6JX38_9GAMM|nr:hypothetical protein [Luteimonas kalidii]MDH5835139.1 hypothetical protein [Luteimonas kalidii]
MTSSRPDPRAPSERDWLAQERALAGAGDRRDALLARALRTAPASVPPHGFAAAVARVAASGPVPHAVPDAGLEGRLLQTLLVLMGLVGAGALALYGPQWWALAREAFGAGGAQWSLVAGICLLLSWLPTAARWLVQERRSPEAAA